MRVKILFLLMSLCAVSCGGSTSQRATPLESPEAPANQTVAPPPSTEEDLLGGFQLGVNPVVGTAMKERFCREQGLRGDECAEAASIAEYEGRYFHGTGFSMDAVLVGACDVEPSIRTVYLRVAREGHGEHVYPMGMVGCQDVDGKGDSDVKIVQTSSLRVGGPQWALISIRENVSSQTEEGDPESEDCCELAITDHTQIRTVVCEANASGSCFTFVSTEIACRGEGCMPATAPEQTPGPATRAGFAQSVRFDGDALVVESNRAAAFETAESSVLPDGRYSLEQLVARDDLRLREPALARRAGRRRGRRR